jgi:hypothetical protein
MDHVRAAREMQLAIWRSWTPARRLEMVGRITAMAVGMRDYRLREMHPDWSEERLRQERVAETLRVSPSRALTP